ncbi:PfkB family carbohydrate kinase [Paenibacillus sp. HJGM_3]|uniref:PfkB family carbohydrate kinase n=1 Tax=Paenibacillus sp. HJGM_3 TaxID=3379816 RepID=UPI00385A676F
MSGYATVIGTVFIDCKGFPFQTYIPTGRNLGRIQFVHGGVGRNIAENLGLMGVPTQLVSSVDNTGLGMEVLQRLNSSGVRTEEMARADQEGMGMWMAILNERGDLAGSISQMPNLTAMAEHFAQHGDAIVRSSSHILLELDLNAELSTAVVELAAKLGKPVYGIPGNLDVILQKPQLLTQLACFICNHVEAERLLGRSFIELSESEQLTTIRELARKLGLPQLVVTLGEEGSVYYDGTVGADGEAGVQSVYPVAVEDSSGAGDAYFSGTVMGLMRGLPLRQAVVCGTKVAGWTIESPENNCKTLRDKLSGDAVIAALPLTV